MEIKSLVFKIQYFIKHWKMVFHLLIGTYHFGVNNNLWANQRSLFGSPISSLFTKLLLNYKMMRMRAFSGFIPLDDAIKLFPEYAKKHQYIQK